MAQAPAQGAKAPAKKSPRGAARPSFFGTVTHCLRLPKPATALDAHWLEARNMLPLRHADDEPAFLRLVRLCRDTDHLVVLDSHGRSLLWFAAKANDESATRIILENGGGMLCSIADADEGFVPLDFALRKKNEALVRLLGAVDDSAGDAGHADGDYDFDIRAAEMGACCPGFVRERQRSTGTSPTAAARALAAPAVYASSPTAKRSDKARSAATLVDVAAPPAPVAVAPPAPVAVEVKVAATETETAILLEDRAPSEHVAVEKVDEKGDEAQAEHVEAAVAAVAAEHVAAVAGEHVAAVSFVEDVFLPEPAPDVAVPAAPIREDGAATAAVVTVAGAAAALLEGAAALLENLAPPAPAPTARHSAVGAPEVTRLSAADAAHMDDFDDDEPADEQPPRDEPPRDVELARDNSPARDEPRRDDSRPPAAPGGVSSPRRSAHRDFVGYRAEARDYIEAIADGPTIDDGDDDDYFGLGCMACGLR
ncbi:hypothetical protein M885DRAFT_524342 [Pelagophyceae sp. CCMP2097]|nr:hypothetical protein M885DRAFT_524342 [Pelagophyceae sp. CCMP2097]